MSSATPHRIDPPATDVPRRVGHPTSKSLNRSHAAVDAATDDSAGQRMEAGQRTETEYGDAKQAGSFCDAPSQFDPSELPAPSELLNEKRLESQQGESAQSGPSQDEWLRLHATDLIDRLQTWASDLDAREAQLNSRTSIQEHRERQFRLRQQDLATELAEQQRSIDRLRQEIEAQARRLAFQTELG